jgi:hypothetical protein
MTNDLSAPFEGFIEGFDFPVEAKTVSIQSDAIMTNDLGELVERFDMLRLITNHS